MKNITYLLLFFILFQSCGYIDSGTFEDDPKTWEKVFGEEQPEDIKVIKSRFWKSAHFTYEFELFMKIQSNKDFINSYFIKKFNFKKVEQPRFDDGFSERKPKWFKIGDFNEYEIYSSETYDFDLLINKKTKVTLIHMIQL